MSDFPPSAPQDTLVPLPLSTIYYLLLCFQVYACLTYEAYITPITNTVISAGSQYSLRFTNIHFPFHSFLCFSVSSAIIFLLPKEFPLVFLFEACANDVFSSLSSDWKCLYFIFFFRVFSLGIEFHVGSYFLSFSFYGLLPFIISIYKSVIDTYSVVAYPLPWARWQQEKVLH